MLACWRRKAGACSHTKPLSSINPIPHLRPRQLCPGRLPAAERESKEGNQAAVQQRGTAAGEVGGNQSLPVCKKHAQVIPKKAESREGCSAPVSPEHETKQRAMSAAKWLNKALPRVVHPQPPLLREQSPRLQLHRMDVTTGRGTENLLLQSLIFYHYGSYFIKQI